MLIDINFVVVGTRGCFFFEVEKVSPVFQPSISVHHLCTLHVVALILHDSTGHMPPCDTCVLVSTSQCGLEVVFYNCTCTVLVCCLTIHVSH